MSPFKRYAVTLTELGFSPVPIVPGEKRPLGQCAFYGHWNELRATALLPRQIDILTRSNPKLGLGVAGGYNCLVPVDIDTNDPAIKRAAFSVLPPAKVVKQGKKGGTIFYWNSDGLIEARKFKVPKGNGWDFLAEILVTGQSVLPPTIHPETLLPYKWLTSSTLFNTKVDDLPEIRKEHIDALAEAFKPWMPKPEYFSSARRCCLHVTADEKLEAYAKGCLRGEAARLATFPEGRNIGLFHAARRLSKYVTAGVLAQREVEVALMEATRTNGYTRKPNGVRMAFKTLRSGLRLGAHEPLPDLCGWTIL